MFTGSFDFGAGAMETGIQAYHNYEMQERDQQWKEKMYQEGIKQRDYMNEYNLPVNQMNRFSEAGLNRHLIYSKGTPGNQTTQPALAARENYPTDFKGSLSGLNPLGLKGMIQDLNQKVANVNLTNQRTKGEAWKNKILEGSAQAMIDNKINSNLLVIEKTTSEKIRQNLLSENIALTEQKKRFETTRADMADDRIFSTDHIMLRQGQKHGVNFFSRLWDAYKKNPTNPIPELYRSYE